MGVRNEGLMRSCGSHVTQVPLAHSYIPEPLSASRPIIAAHHKNVPNPVSMGRVCRSFDESAEQFFCQSKSAYISRTVCRLTSRSVMTSFEVSIG